MKINKILVMLAEENNINMVHKTMIDEKKCLRNQNIIYLYGGLIL